MRTARDQRVQWAIFILAMMVALCLISGTKAAATAEQIDQSNVPPWAGGWTHVNPTGDAQATMWQTFTPGRPGITAVEIDILTVSPGLGDDTLTVEITKDGQLLASADCYVQDGFDGLLRFDFPAMVSVVPEQLYELRVRDTGRTRFGWKYASNTYDRGSRYVNANERPNTDWFFQTYSPVAPRIIYVDGDAAGANDGSSWANAYTFLQEALADAQTAEKPLEIRVAQGIYKPYRGNQLLGYREATFQLINGVVIKGGFAGISELDPDVRKVQVYETILSGDLNGDDVEVAINKDLSDETSREDNSYHVVTGSGTDATAMLDGLTITGGNAAGSSYDAHGGGAFNETGSPSITNCTFILNSTRSNGGGMFNRNSSPNLTNCTFTMNSAHSGSGIYNDHNSNPTVTNCMFIDNAAYYGSGMYNWEASNPVLNDCIFSGGISEYQGGGINNSYLSNPTLINCTFIGNSARDGAGMHNYESSPIITNCTFTGNKAESGGGMCNEIASHPILTNCTFSRNIAEAGNALACNNFFGHIKWYPSIIDLRNCIIWDGGNEIYNRDGSTINITYSNVPNSQTAIYSPYEDVIWGEGNINTDPLFVDADGDDNIVGTEDDDLRLLEGSPCIDAGDSSAVSPSIVTDMEGNPRITNSRVDMGAYERPAKYFLLSTWPFSVPEGSTTSFTVALAEPPSETVEVTVAHYSGDQDITIESGGLLSFDTSNYSVPQTVTLSAAEDSDNLNGTARIRISTPNVFADVKVTESDNEPYVGVLFVDDDAAGNNNGSNWTDAYINLQDALNPAASIGVQEIRIAQGVYRPDRGSGSIPGDRTATFKPINGVAIKGGFAGFSEVDPDIRDVEIYETILSGDLADNDFDVNDPVVLPYESTRADNSYHVVTGSGINGTAVLDGVTISGGKCGSRLEHGGGMYIIAGSPTISNCTFIQNWAWYGGGIYNGNSSPTLTNCTFSLNSGFHGGGMYNQSGHPSLTNCLFTHNSSTIHPGVIVERSVDSGGGMYNYHSNPTLANCTISGNSSTYGGGIYNYDSHLILTNCTLAGNSAYEGRAIYNFRSNPVVRNCILWNGGNEIQSGFTSSINVTFSDIQGGWEGEGNIDVDPLFADPDNGDFHLKSEYGRWDSASDGWVVDDVTSPCIDAGDPNSPVGDEPEPNGGRINMGAYGGTAEASKSHTSWWFVTTGGPVVAEGLGIILPHEHIFTDLRGPTTPGYGQADPADVVRVMAPLLTDAHRKGIGVMIECSSIGVGRNAPIVAQVAEAAGLPVVVPTGVYGRANFAPPEHRAMTEDELTALFTDEIRNGIEGTGIKAGFIKIATDNGPMTALEEKFLRAAGRAASRTGAAIASHTPIGSNAVRQTDILQSIDPAIRFIWVHAQNESNRSLHRQLAARGVFIEFDSLGWNPGQDSTFIAAIKDLLAAGHADRILLSHDAGWYQPGQRNGGTQKPYTYLIDAFIRKLRSAAVDDATIRLITETNPIRAFGFTSG